MAEERSIRRLAAILAADVVGFSRLMEADEADTMAALKTRRKDVLDPLVAKHQGRVFKVTGDGVLIEFASAVNAVQCTVDFQQAFAAANAGLTDERQIILRIGVNLGDVMVEGGDLYGDGVNIAARLESIADHGGLSPNSRDAFSLPTGTTPIVIERLLVTFEALPGRSKHGRPPVDPQ
jgi:adenylate cyclase